MLGHLAAILALFLAWTPIPPDDASGGLESFIGENGGSAASIAAARDGGFAAAGVKGDKAWIIRLDGQGKMLWAKTLTDVPSTAYAIAALPDGGFAVAGKAGSGEGANRAPWVARLDAQGRTLWARTYPGDDQEAVSAIAATPDGGFAIAGGWRVMRLDGEGKQLWRKPISNDERGEAHAVVAFADNSLAVAGERWPKPSCGCDGGDRGRDAYVVRLDSGGAVLWEKVFGGAGLDIARSAVALPDGGLAVAGITDSQGAGSLDAWAFRLDGGGAVVWEKTFGGPDWDEAGAIASAPDGGFVLSGARESESHDDRVAWALRLDAQGAVLWEKLFDGQGALLWEKLFDARKRYEAAAAAVSLDGAAALAGVIRPADAFRERAWIVIISPREQEQLTAGK